MTVLSYTLPDPRAGVDVQHALVLSGGATRASFGREPTCEVVLASERVGRRHCEIVQLTEGDALVKDEGSVNGTFVDDVLVQGQARLHDGAVMRLADALELSVHAPQAVPEDPLAGAAVARVDAMVACLADLEGVGEELYTLDLDPPSLSPHRYGKAARAWLAAVARAELVDHRFGWRQWGAEAATWREDPERLASADLATVRRLLTCIIRGERFHGGTLARHLRDGHVVALTRRLGDLRDASVAARLQSLGDTPVRDLVEALYAFGRVEHRLGVGQTVSEIPFPGGRQKVGTGSSTWEFDAGGAAFSAMLAPGGPQAEVTMSDGFSAGLDARHPDYELMNGGSPPPWSAAADGLFALGEVGVVALILGGRAGERVTADLRADRWTVSFRPGPRSKPAASSSRGRADDRLIVVQSEPPGVDDLPLTTRVVTVGRSPRCTVTLRGGSASRHHAELRRKGRAWTVVDCGSQNGTRVNGQRIKARALESGDRLEFGHVVAYFVASSPWHGRGR